MTGCAKLAEKKEMELPSAHDTVTHYNNNTLIQTIKQKLLHM